MSLSREGANVTIVARNADRLHRQAEVIRRETGGRVDSVVADVTTEDGRAHLLDQAGLADILINNSAGPAPGNFRDWDRDDWIAAFDASMLSAVSLIKVHVDVMAERDFGRIVNITSAVVKALDALLGLSTTARLGLTGYVSGVSREVARYNVTVNNLMPGYFSTGRLEKVIDSWARAEDSDTATTAAARAALVPGGRFGNPSEFGDYCAFLSSAQAGYITGQNLMLDGGLYPGVF